MQLKQYQPRNFRSPSVNLARAARKALAPTATKPQPQPSVEDEISRQRLAERMGMTPLPPPVERDGNNVTFNAFFDPKKKREKP